jgi:hypothetical protein
MPKRPKGYWAGIFERSLKESEKKIRARALARQVTFPSVLRGLRQRVLASQDRANQAQAFCFPLPTPARIALLEAGFRPGPNMCECTVDDLPWLRIWGPEALVLPLSLALLLANRKQLGLFELPSLDTALVVLTSLDESPLASRHRDLLWRVFGVPVFEQLRGSDGAVIASECEVHDGLHFQHAQFPGLKGEIVADHCACGAETPRLRSQAFKKAATAA